MSVLPAAIRRFLAEEDGPTAIEYVVMSSLVLAIALLAIGLFGEVTSSTFKGNARSIIDITGDNRVFDERNGR